jgi:hypothetical protein
MNLLFSLHPAYSSSQSPVAAASETHWQLTPDHRPLLFRIAIPAPHREAQEELNT